MSTPVVVAEFVLKEAVTPLGKPDAVSSTLPLNGLISVIVMVSLALLPGSSSREACEGASVIFPAVLTVSEMLVEADMIPDAPLIVIV